MVLTGVVMLGSRHGCDVVERTGERADIIRNEKQVTAHRGCAVDVDIVESGIQKCSINTKIKNTVGEHNEFIFSNFYVSLHYL